MASRKQPEEPVNRFDRSAEAVRGWRIDERDGEQLRDDVERLRESS